MNQNGDNPRLDRIEAALEVMVQVQADMQQEHKALPRAQVLQGDELRQLSKRTDEKFQALAESQQRLAESQQRMDDAHGHSRSDEALGVGQNLNYA